MKTRDMIWGLGSVLGACLLCTACDDDDNAWQPGPVVGDGHQNIVYFVGSAPSTTELRTDVTTDYAITVARMDSTEAISVPLVAQGSDAFEVPETIEFPAGVGTTQFNVHFKGAPKSGTFSLALSIEDIRYNNPYTSLTTQLEFSQDVAKWVLVSSNVRFSEYYGQMSSFECDLYQREGENIYRFVDFGEGYDLTFVADSIPATDENAYFGNYIHPTGGYTGSFYGSDAWYFASEPDAAYNIKLRNAEGRSIDYSVLYLNTSYTTISFDTKSGWINGYFYQYDADYVFETSYYAFLYFEWDDPAE
jgi:hypothetical protein